MDDIYAGMRAVKERLEEKLRHPYVMRHIDIPFIDEDKLLLLCSVLRSANLHIDEIQHYALTIMLVQIALDTHEKVSNKAESEDSHTKRQLTALAGDYYSGLYYYLLAEQKDVMLIRVLASGIEEINEEKVALYREGGKTIDDIVKRLSIIESALLQKTCDYFRVPVWKSFITGVSILRRMEREYVLHQKQEDVLVHFGIVAGEDAARAYEMCIKNAKKELYELAKGHEQLIKIVKMLNI